MKKILVLIMFAFATIGLVACGGSLNLVISKLFTATNAAMTTGLPADNVIELFNNSNRTLDMSNAAIRVYMSGNPNNTQEIQLSGTLAPNSYFVIIGPRHSNAAVSARADFVHTSTLIIRGEDAVALVWNGQVHDRVGYPDGIGAWVSGFSTLIRAGEPTDFKPATTLTDQAFIAYVPNLWDYLGVWVHEIRTIDQLLAGPRLERDRVSQLNFMDVAADGSRSGGGGIVTVNLVSVTDGDTARFSGSEFLTALGSSATNIALRYVYLQTPEIGSRAEPWGYVADFYHRNFIHPNDGAGQEIIIQSIPGGVALDTFARALGIVWVNGYLQAFMMYAEGLTILQAPGPSTADLGLTYKNVPILTFLIAAQQRAIEMGLGLHGDLIPPDWNVFNNTTLGANTANWNSQWTPRFPELLPNTATTQ